MTKKRKEPVSVCPRCKRAVVTVATQKKPTKGLASDHPHIDRV